MQIQCPPPECSICVDSKISIWQCVHNGKSTGVQKTECGSKNDPTHHSSQYSTVSHVLLVPATLVSSESEVLILKGDTLSGGTKQENH